MNPPGPPPESESAPQDPGAARAAAPITLQFAIETFDQPAFILDRLSQIQCANHPVADNPCFKRFVRVAEDGQVTLHDPAAQRMFEHALRKANENAPTDVTIRSASGDPEALISVYPISAMRELAPISDAGHGKAGIALVIVRKLIDPTAPGNLMMMRHLYGLTPAEARLSALLARGASLDHASGALGISKETARTQLKGIFSKTDTNRQPQLVALLARLFQRGED